MGLLLTYMVLNLSTSTGCETSPHTCNPTKQWLSYKIKIQIQMHCLLIILWPLSRILKLDQKLVKNLAKPGKKQLKLFGLVLG